VVKSLRFSLCFFPYFSFFFYFSSKTGQGAKKKIRRKNGPYMEEIRAKFQRDPLKGFRGKSILPDL